MAIRHLARLWKSPEAWGSAGAIAGWGMTGAAIYDGYNNPPDVISESMTGVLIVYSSLFARWAWVIQPKNIMLCGCHISNVAAQIGQITRRINHATDEDALKIKKNTIACGIAGGATMLTYPFLSSAMISCGGAIESLAISPVGPLTVHFWAPLSKWLISGASFLELDRPTDKISIAQYSALTATGFFFTRYALLVSPVNYMLCTVNMALFSSSAWHLGRKLNADYNT